MERSIMTLEQAPETSADRVLALYREIGVRLYAFALGFVGRKADAEDVVQEAFLRLAEHLRAGPSDTNVRAWLYRVAGNLCHDVTRSRRRRADGPADAPVAEPEPLRSLAIRRVLARLGDRDRKLLLLRGEGMSYAEIAAAAELNPVSVGKLLARALERFGAEYRREYEGGGRGR